KVAVRWVGGMTVAQVERLASSDPLVAKRRAHSQGAHGGGELARADSLYGEANYGAAARAYQQVLAANPQGGSYTRSVDALLFSLSQVDSSELCVEAAHDALPRLAGTPSLASAVAQGLDCALSLPPDHPQRAERIAEFEHACRAVLADTTL